jgi:hypothetical protein
VAGLWRPLKAILRIGALEAFKSDFEDQDFGPFGPHKNPLVAFYLG